MIFASSLGRCPGPENREYVKESVTLTRCTPALGRRSISVTTTVAWPTEYIYNAYICIYINIHIWSFESLGMSSLKTFFCLFLARTSTPRLRLVPCSEFDPTPGTPGTPGTHRGAKSCQVSLSPSSHGPSRKPELIGLLQPDEALGNCN
jgi:hypothetical protein